MSLTDIANVSITTETSGVRQAGFGTCLILGYNATWGDRIRFYTQASDLLDDGFTATQPEYLAAVKLMSQEQKPEQFAVGRGTLKPTQAYKISLAAVTAGEVYSMRVGDDDIEITAGAGTFATNDYIVTQLLSAINTAAPTGFTAASAGTPGSTYLTLTASTAGNFIGVESYDLGLILVEQNHADPGVATDLAAIKAVDDTWYGLVNLFNSKAQATAAAVWTEANEKLFGCASGDSVCATTAVAGATDLAANLATAAYARTFVIYHPAPDQFADAAWMGECLPFDPGSETWKFKTLAGVDATVLTTTQKTNLNNKKANYYEEIAGINVTAGTPGGTVAAGEFIDVVRFRDWLKARIAERVFAKLANSDKIPFTNGGIAVIEAEVRAQLDDGITKGGLSDDPEPTVTVPLASAVSAANKAARHLPDVEFEATLAGAIHRITISGTISL